VNRAHSPAFELFHRAILKREQVTCSYQGHYREVCPHILGHSGGRETVLVYQFGGESSRGLPGEGEWRCFLLDQIRDAATRDGGWHTGAAHSQTQRCVDVVYVDVNTEVPNQPGRR
jgi:uncharacterized protein